MDKGAHSDTCANSIGGICHCECNGTQHGISHLAGSTSARKRQIRTRPHDSGGVTVTTAGGMPPGGGTKEERLRMRSAQVKVTDSRSTPAAQPAYVPRHIQAALDAVDGKPNPHSAPLSYVYGGVSKQSYRDHFTAEQRAKVLAKLEEISEQMQRKHPDARDRGMVDRAIGWLRDLRDEDVPKGRGKSKT